MRPFAYSFSSPKKLRQGFTLLELMVVIFIIGILLSLATISVSTRSDHSLETEARRFASLMKLASDEAILNARPIAAQLAKKKYQFSISGELENEDTLLRPRDIPEHIALEVVIEDDEIDFDALDAESFANIYILPSGEMTPFSVIFSQADGLAYEVTGDFMGKIAYVGKVKRSEK
ncbi:MAG TPA: type II secretion system protein GspH [Gammaproteobacteria bacterium]|nr:type II secretion system protein GspH [Gammaproteobacteria bacterium]